MNQIKRTISLLMALLMVIVLFPAISPQVNAVEYVDVSSIDELKKALEMDGDVYIKITENISGVFDADYSSTTTELLVGNDDGTLSTVLETMTSESNDKWAVVGPGDKTLDLNGMSVEVKYNEWKDRCSTLIVIPAGSSVTVNDANNEGELFYNGYIPGYDAYWTDDWEAAVTQNRDIFLVDGGSLTVNGGRITAGRSKNEYVTRGTEKDWQGHFPDDGLEQFLAVLWSGEATKCVNGTAITVNSGSVVINDGIFTGRGLHFWKLISDSNVDGWPSSAQHWVRNAVLEARGGRVTINNGVFRGKGNADCLRIESGVSFNIKAAKLQLHHNDWIAIASKSFISSDRDHLSVSPGSYGSIGLPDQCYTDSGLKIFYYGKDAQSTIKDTADYLLTCTKDLDEPYFLVKPNYDVRYTLTSDYDPISNLAQLNPDQPEQWVFNLKTSSLYSDYPLAGESRTWITTYTIKVYDKDKNTLALTEKSDEISFPVAGDLLPSVTLANYSHLFQQMQPGESYFVAVIAEEKLSGANPLVSARVGVCPVLATSTEEPIILTHTSGPLVADKKGDTVTLTATAVNADYANWFYQTPDGLITPITSGTVTTSTDGSRFTSVIRFPAEENKEVVVFFYNRIGETRSDPISVTAKPDPVFDTSESIVTTYTSVHTAYLSGKVDDSVEIKQISWYKNNTLLTTDDSHYVFMGQTLQINEPTLDDAGEYYYILDTDRGTFTSPVKTLVVIDGASPKYITTAEIHSSLPFVQGGTAPTIDDLYFNDDRFKIKSFSWLSGVENGVFTDQAPSFEIKISSVQVPTYFFQCDDSHYFHWTVEDCELNTYCNWGSFTDPAVSDTYYFSEPLPDHVLIESNSEAGAPIAVSDQIGIDLNSLAEIVSGEAFNQMLPLSLECPHETKHTISSVALKNGSLPDGMSLSASGILSGTPSAVTTTTGFPVTLEIFLSGGESFLLDLTLFVEPSDAVLDEVLSQAETVASSMHSEHSFGAWIDNSDGTHSRFCSDCSASETAPHLWDEGTVIKEASESSLGIIRYTCTDCGATRSVPLVYDGEAKLESLAEGSPEPESPAESSPEPESPAEGGKEAELPSAETAPEILFSDVAPGAYYSEAVAWAVDSGITSGTSSTTFSPDLSCTRGQVVTFLWRAQGAPEPMGTATAFTDVKAGAYYEKAVQWAVENGITSGTSSTTFSPDASCSRGQVVTFLWRMEKSPSPAGSATTFTDVKPGAYYEKAVQWAVENSITSGTSSTTFSPDATCSRGQVVTFLFRDMK